MRRAFPRRTVTIIPVLLEFMGAKGALDVVLFVRHVLRQNESMQAEVLGRLMDTLNSVKSEDVFRVVLWILGEYSSTEDLVTRAFTSVKEALGPLPIVPEGTAVAGEDKKTE